jgi:argininosuccinate lyase
MSTTPQSKVSRRLTEAVAPEVRDLIYGPRLGTDFDDCFPYLHEINLAHLLMLGDCGLLAKEAVAALAKALCRIEAEGPGAMARDPNREDAYFNYEAHLISITEKGVGGSLHLARSRNDILATMDRLRARDLVLQLMELLAQARRTALERASEYAEVVMPGYTHLQPAQPITFGFYLAGVAQALARDGERLSQAFERINRNPLGGGAFAGTSFAIDREATARWLGFSGVVENTLDAVASRDFALELLSAMSVLAVTWSRVAQDFYIWCTHEFQMVDFPDSVASTSSIMPQKKNPVVLEQLRGRSACVVGQMTTGIMAARGLNFTHTGDGSRETVRALWAAGRECVDCLQLFRLAVGSATPNAQLMLRRATADFASATELADALVKHAGLSFRDAHHVVGAVVREAMDRGLPANEITGAMLHAAATEQIGRKVALAEDVLRDCLDPARSIRLRTHAGGPAPDAVRKTLAKLGEELARDEAQNTSRKAAVASSRTKLRDEVAKRARAGG